MPIYIFIQGIPSLTDQGQNGLLHTWKLLIRLLQAKNLAQNDGSTLQNERHYLNFMLQSVYSLQVVRTSFRRLFSQRFNNQLNHFLDQTDSSSNNHRVLTVPRDLKKDFQPRPGSIIPNLETLKKIKVRLSLLILQVLAKSLHYNLHFFQFTNPFFIFEST